MVDGVHKRFGDVHALSGVDLVVERGTVLGLLGPNGAGKTTIVKILTTLLPPDDGRALVEGRDVVRSPDAVREVIGLAGQSAAIQDELTGRENLEILGRLYHLGRRQARARAAELLERFDLAGSADRPAKTYSGGMQRRLDLAASLVAEPPVLFLDEPTTGLDPRSRIGMWAVIRELVKSGTTLLLTTQYLDEADELADEIVVIDHGLVIAAGTAEALKTRIGGDVLELTIAEAGGGSSSRLADAARVLTGIGDGEPTVDADSGTVRVPVGEHSSQAVVQAVRALDAAGIEADGLGVRRPSLDDVFLSLTGHTAGNEPENAPGRRRRRSGSDRRRGAPAQHSAGTTGDAVGGAAHDRSEGTAP